MRSTPSFIIADPVRDRNCLLEMNIEYMGWNFVQVQAAFGIDVPALVGMPVEEYVESVIDKVCGDPPPNGIFYMIECDGHVAGMGGFRKIREGMSEMKRLYVRPRFRGRHLGEAIVNRILSDAKSFGFTHMVLDSGPHMTSAHRIYESAGFTDCPAYPETEVPPTFYSGWRFMERSLSP